MKIFIQVLLQIIISIPVYLVVFLLFRENIKTDSLAYSIIVLFLFTLVLLITLKILKNKISQKEVDSFSKKLGIVYLGIAIAECIVFEVDIHSIFYAPIAFLAYRYFLKLK